MYPECTLIKFTSFSIVMMSLYYRLRQEPVDEEEAKEDKPEEAKEDKDSDDDDATVEDKHKTKKVWLVINS